jgi:hypothetical protein
MEEPATMRESTDWKVPFSHVRLAGHAGGTLSGLSL